jgi:biopolymer transport protein ExbD
MVAAPLSTVDLPVDLPTSSAVPQPKPEKPVYVTVRPDLTVFLNEQPVKRVELVRTLDAMPGPGKSRRVLLRADRTVPYGELMNVIEILWVGGYAKVALVAAEKAAAASPGLSPEAR